MSLKSGPVPKIQFLLKRLSSFFACMEKAYLITLSGEELEELISASVQKTLQEFFSNTPLTTQNAQLGGIELAERVTGLSKSTIYGLVSKRQIPHKKRGHRLYFLETELIDWINQHHRKTVYEIEQEAADYFTKLQLKPRRKNK